MAEASEAFSALLDALMVDPDVGPGTIFGHPAAKVGKKVFCCEVDGDLVLKVGRERVAEIMASTEGTVFDPMGGRPMKDWVVVPPPAGDPVAGWIDLAEEAKAVVLDGKAG